MRKCLTSIIGLALLTMATTVQAGTDSVEDLKQTVNQLQNRIAELETKQDQAMRREIHRDEVVALIKELNADAAAHSGMPSWLEDLKFFGDLRLRYENTCYGPRAKERHRARYRLRFGIKKYWLDKELEVGFRIASGSSDGPTSTNQTMGDGFATDELWIDRAYAKYKPKAVEGLMLIGGKMGNPLVSTSMVWDSDVNPEGFFGSYTHKFDDNVEAFVGAGYFIANESQPEHDTILMAYQGGVNAKIGDVALTAAATWYDWDHYVNSVGGVDFDKMQALNLTLKAKTKIAGLGVGGYVDFIKNLGSENEPAPFEGEDTGYAAGIKLGGNKKKGDWSLGYEYKHIEANATANDFDDSDFGGTNRKGHAWKGKYSLTDDVSVGGAVFWTEDIKGPDAGDRDVITQIDLVWKF
ncbi:MAG: putative porin [Phycisphaerae bacterium]